MSALLTLPHLPILLCLIAGGAAMVAPSRMDGRWRRWVALCVSIGAAAILLRMLPSLPVDVAFSEWLADLTLLGTLVFHVDEIGWLFAALLTLGLGAKLAAGSLHEEGEQGAHELFGLFLMAGALYAILFAGNLLTLLFGWAALTAAGFAMLAMSGLEGRVLRAYLALFGLAVSLILVATWYGGQGDGGRWSSLGGSDTAVALIFVVAAIAVAAYPFHLWLPDEDTPDLVTAFLHYVMPLAGLYLLVRVESLQSGMWGGEGWAAAAVVGLLAASESAWLQPRRRLQLRYLAATAGAASVLVVALPGSASIAQLIAWAGAAPAAFLALLILPGRGGEDDPSWIDWWLRGVRAVAAGGLVGLPLTGGFAVWSRLYAGAEVWPGTNGTLVRIALLAAAVLTAACLFRHCLYARPAGIVPNARRLGVIGLVLLVPIVGSGLVAERLTPQVTGAGALSGDPLVLAAVAVAVTLGYALYAWRATAPSRLGALQPVLAGVLGLGWIATLVEACMGWLTRVLGVVSDLLHGDHHLIWAFLAILLFVWFYLFP